MLKTSCLYLVSKNRWFRFYLRILLGIVLTLLLAIESVFIPAVQATPQSVVKTLSNAAQQEQLGREYYQADRFYAALEIWQQTLRVYQYRADKLNQARVLSNLSLAYQQLGQWKQATQAITDSLKLVQLSNPSSKQLKVLAQALNTQGTLQLATGKPQLALSTWQEAANTYKKAKNETGAIRSLINQSQALKSLGLYRKALSTLEEVNQILQEQADSPTKAAALRNLGTSLRLVGNLERAKEVLNASLTLAQKLQLPSDISSTLLALGNVAYTNQKPESALDFYQQAAIFAASQSDQINAQLNQLSVLIKMEKWVNARLLASKIQPPLIKLTPNRTTIYAQLNLAESLINLHLANSHTPDMATIAELIATSYQQAENLGDKRLEAYALGKLGSLYEKTQQLSNAQKLTEKALMLAQAINSPEISYRWQWQLGRILKAQGNIENAIAAYQQSVSTLQFLRSDLLAVESDIQYSFRDSVEPVYRELVALLVHGESSESNQENLLQAREVIESLQVAELENFFHEACLDSKTAEVERIDTQAAIIYPIILKNNLEIILSLPQQPLHHYTIAVPQQQLETTVEKLRQNLVIRTRYSFMPLSKQLYDWLIRPLEKELASSGVKTLVLVPDGVLRNIPIAVLHDGDQYLLEKYSIAFTPSLKLLPPRKLQQNNFKVLGAGLSEARQGFSALEFVEEEFKKIKLEVSSTVLLNQKFTRENVENNLQSNSFPIVHIATHGQFSSKAIETFILTWNDRIRINDLDNLLDRSQLPHQQAIELLVLSACETAVGDNRAALGLAGIAVKAGARSTLATLWPVNDESTANLMGQFYKELSNTKQNKAEALRNSQLALLKDPNYEHPLYWAPYILVGNWL
ncbi:CHAT domain-containing protein [Calothrix sp. CCY 0018]|uniref:CHAT domain-containing protein n=1 Tax=Calothrix sp. CCY 0018 TaxID=3103864 RepID=UPI0039C65905